MYVKNGFTVDSKAIPSFGNPVRDDEKLKEEDRRRDTDADWGTKTYRCGGAPSRHPRRHGRDRRIFTPIARHTDKWEKAYDRRTSVERVNSRLDQVLGFEHHTIRGKAKMEMRVTLALVVMLAMALGRIRAGQSDRMRSMTAPVARAA